MTLTAPALPAELPPHHRPVPRILAALAAAAVVAASTIVGLASPASAEGENVVPVAVGDSYSTPQGTQLVVPGPGVIANDVDPDSTLTLFSVNKVDIAGSVFVNNDGGFTYTPAAGFAGDTSFQYRVIEVGTNQFSDWATVTITVVPPVVPPAVPNALPVTVADAFTTPFETPLVVSTSERLLLNDSDADGDPIVAVSNWAPSVGTLTSYSDQGTFTFTPPAGFSGDATFTYYAFDHKAQGNTVSVTITVLPPAQPNTPPVGVDDWYYVTPGENYSLPGSVVLFSATDVDGDPISVQWVTFLTGDFSQGVDGSIDWSVPADFCGTIDLQYRPFDGIDAGNLTTVQLRAMESDTGNYLPCADPVPVLNSVPIAVDDQFTVKPGETLSIPAATGVLINDTDADGDALTVVAKAVPNLGSGFALDSDGALTWTAPADFCNEVTFSYAALDAESESDYAFVTIRAIDEKDFVVCPDEEQPGEEPTDEPGSPTITTLPVPTDPGTPGGEPELSDAPATPGRDTLAYTGAADELAQGVGWGALLAIMLGLGLTVARVRRGAGA